MSPKTKEQIEKIREQSRKKILDAALRLFAQKGFDGTSVSGVAKEAGVAKGLIYNYFSSKEDLVHQLVISGADVAEEVVGELMGLPSVSERFRFVFEWFYREMQERFEYYKLLTMLSLKLDAFPEMQDFANAKYEGYIPIMTAFLAEKGVENPEVEGRLLAATLDGIGIQYLVLKDRLPFRKMIDDLIEKYCD